MDVTPNSKMQKAMDMFVGASIGGAPPLKDTSNAATSTRAKRTQAYEILYGLVAIAMREGVNRAIREAKERRAGPQDAADRNAMAQARDDAQADRKRVILPDFPH